MDNWTLRQPQLAEAMRRQAPSESDTQGLGVKLQTRVGGRTVLDWGVDYVDLQRWAKVQDAKGVDLFWLWPDAQIETWGLFAEARHALDARRGLTFGLRYDRVAASAGRRPLSISTHPLVPAATRDAAGQEQDENHLAALLRYEQALGGGLWLNAGLSRTLRTADTTERYVLKAGKLPSGEGVVTWLGNPALEPEQHLQLDLGLEQRQGALTWGGNLFWDEVDDYILRDQMARNTSKGTVYSQTGYRNVSARLYGAEASLRWQLAPGWTGTTQLAYVRGENTSDDRNLAQMPPFNAQIGLEHERGRWLAGGKLRLAAQQSEIDPQSGLDSEETDGYAVLDLYGRWQAHRQVTLSLGIDNLFDTDYAEHVNRAYAGLFGDPEARIHEPGRTVWVKLNAVF